MCSMNVVKQLFSIFFVCIAGFIYNECFSGIVAFFCFASHLFPFANSTFAPANFAFALAFLGNEICLMTVLPWLGASEFWFRQSSTARMPCSSRSTAWRICCPTSANGLSGGTAGQTTSVSEGWTTWLRRGRMSIFWCWTLRCILPREAWQVSLIPTQEAKHQSQLTCHLWPSLRWAANSKTKFELSLLVYKIIPCFLMCRSPPLSLLGFKICSTQLCLSFQVETRC